MMGKISGVWGVALIILAAGLAMGVDAQTKAKEQRAGARKTLEVRVEALKEAFEEREPILVRVSLKNASDKDVYLFRTLLPEGLFVLFTVVDEQSAQVYQSPRTMMERTAAFVEDTFLLSAGYSWGAVFRLGVTAASEEPLRLPPGRYWLRAVYTNRDPDGKGGTLTGTFIADPVEIRVTKPKKEEEKK